MFLRMNLDYLNIVRLEFEVFAHVGSSPIRMKVYFQVISHVNFPSKALASEKSSHFRTKIALKTALIVYFEANAST